MVQPPVTNLVLMWGGALISNVIDLADDTCADATDGLEQLGLLRHVRHRG